MRSVWACQVRSGTIEHLVHGPRSALHDCRILSRYRCGSLWADLWCWQVAPGFAPVGFRPVHAPAQWLPPHGLRLDDRQALNAATFSRAVNHEVHGPHLIGSR